MTDPNLTHVTVVLDRSGSMGAIESDTVGGYNAFIDTQRKVPGKCGVTLIRFNDLSHEDYTADVATVPKLLALEPHGNTALHDAICMAIDSLGAQLAAMPEPSRPGKVVFVILTDGHENASRKFHAQDVKARIQRQEREYGWQFVYLGANQDAILVGESMGIRAANSVSYDQHMSSEGITRTGGKLASYRVSGQSADMSYTAQDRQDLSQS